MIYLLDLNQTLAKRERGEPKLSPFTKHIEFETYRADLVEFLKNKYVILITARPDKYKKLSLESITSKTGWTPQEAYFAEKFNYPHVIKKHILEEYIFPKHGIDGDEYFGIESNPKTRAVYSNFGIEALDYRSFKTKMNF